MPIPRRWHPVSRDLNHDPEVWELTDQFGDRSLRIWLEMLAWVDRTEDHRIPLSSQWFASLAQATKTNLKTVVQTVAWMIDREWLVLHGDEQSAEQWVEGLKALSKDWPKTHRRLAGNLSETRRRIVEEWAENGRKLSLSTANYLKYHRRPVLAGSDKGAEKGGPNLTYPSLRKEEGKKITLASPGMGSCQYREKDKAARFIKTCGKPLTHGQSRFCKEHSEQSPILAEGTQIS